jgi:UDP-arabinose 4-epimerase
MARAVLVTGGAGFVGSHVCKALHKEGYLPIVFDNLSHGHRWAVRYGPLEIGDILNTQRLVEALRRHRPTAVMHFASCISVGESVADPGKYYRNNVTGTLSLLEAMRETATRQLVFSSSAAVYGNPLRLPLDEEHPQAPVSPYGASKQMCERMISDFASAHEFSTAALRYFNAAGADPDGELGEEHEPETHLIPLVLEVAAGLRAAVDVFGDAYPTHDGTCVRDYVHVTDLAQAHVLALRKLDTGTGSLAFNLGTGNGNTVMEVVRTVRRVTGREVPVRMAPRRAGDPAVLLADGSRARTELGWAPQYTDLDDIVRHAWRWYRGVRRGFELRAVHQA